MGNLFTRIPGGGFALTVARVPIRIEFYDLRRRDGQWHADCAVFCDVPGARTYAGRLSHSALNLSSQTQRVQRAKHCAERAAIKSEEFDFVGLLDEACIRAIDAARESSPAILLDDAPMLGD